MPAVLLRPTERESSCLRGSPDYTCIRSKVSLSGASRWEPSRVTGAGAQQRAPPRRQPAGPGVGGGGRHRLGTQRSRRRRRRRGGHSVVVVAGGGGGEMPRRGADQPFGPVGEGDEVHGPRIVEYVGLVVYRQYGDISPRVNYMHTMHILASSMRMILRCMHITS